MPFLSFPAKKDTATGLLVELGATSVGLLRCFYSSDVSQWVIVDASNFTPSIELDGKSFQPCHITYLGEPVWRDTSPNFSGVVFMSASGSWVYTPSDSLPEEPAAYYDEIDEEWKGDGWWELTSMPTMDSPIGSLTAKGTFINDSTLQPPSCVMKWPRWQRLAQQSSVAPYGEYLARDGVSTAREKRHVGAPCYTSNSGSVNWVLSRDSYRRYESSDGRRLGKNGSKWVCGERGGATTWWEGDDAPNPDEPVTYTAMKMEDGRAVVDPDTPDILLEFSAYGPYAGRMEVVMTEVALWR